MNGFSDLGWRSVRRMILLLACFQALCACGKNEIPVNIHGVNYEDSAFSYVMSDLQKKENRAGGELIEPFSAGGITCCYLLPRKWRQGLKVQVNWTYWESKAGNDELDETKKIVQLDIPPYAEGKPPEVWILRTGVGLLALVGSNLQPDHADWPGTIKGWPVPSVEYQRERWAIHEKMARGYVELYKGLLTSLSESPAKELKESWTTAAENMPATLKGFSGYNDPKYYEYLERRYRAELKASEAELTEILKGRP